MKEKHRWVCVCPTNVWNWDGRKQNTARADMCVHNKSYNVHRCIREKNKCFSCLSTGTFSGENMPHEKEHSLQTCLKAAVYVYVVAFRRLQLFPMHAVFFNPSSSFWCHLQWEVLHCAFWLTLSISRHSDLFFASLTSSLHLLWHNLSPAFFF